MKWSPGESCGHDCVIDDRDVAPSVGGLPRFMTPTNLAEFGIKVSVDYRSKTSPATSPSTSDARIISRGVTSVSALSSPTLGQHVMPCVDPE